MSDIFEPFFDYGNIETIEKKLEEIFALSELPIIRMNGDTLPKFHKAGGAGYYVSTLTQHIAFMLAQPSSVVGGGNTWSEDTSWVYKFRRLNVPVYLSGTKFQPCYIWQCLPAEFASVFVEKSQQVPAEVEIELDPKHMLQVKDANFTVERSQTLSLAYELALPGHQVLAVTHHAILAGEDGEPPRFNLTIMYRVPKRRGQIVRLILARAALKLECELL